MRNFVFVSFMVLAIVMAVSVNVSFAQTQGTDASVQVNTTAETDLRVDADPGILPTNKTGYFFKKIGEGIARFFTFNPVRKIDLELRLTDRRLSELRKLSQTSQDDGVLVRAVQNYEDNISRLQARLTSLRETSQNPNVDRLLDQVMERGFEHQERINELRANHEELHQSLDDAQSRLDDVVAAVPANDDPERFEKRLERIIERKSVSDDVVEQYKIAKTFDRVQDKVSDDQARDAFEKFKRLLIEKIENYIRSGNLTSQQIDALRAHIDQLRNGAITTQHEAEERFKEILKALSQQRLPEVAQRKIDAAVSAIETLTGQINQCQSGNPIPESQETSRSGRGSDTDRQSLRDDIASLSCDRVAEATARLEAARTLLRQAQTAFTQGNYQEAIARASEAWAKANAGVQMLSHQTPVLPQPPVPIQRPVTPSRPAELCAREFEGAVSQGMSPATVAQRAIDAGADAVARLEATLRSQPQDAITIERIRLNEAVRVLNEARTSFSAREYASAYCGAMHAVTIVNVVLTAPAGAPAERAQ